MLFRKCAGGIVFHGDSVFLLKNEKDEWVLPKGVIRGEDAIRTVALRRVLLEAGITAEILSPAGETSYEFYSITRRQPVCNAISWFIMRAKDPRYAVDLSQGFKDGAYFPIQEALKRITYSQDRALLSLAHQKYRKLLEDIR
jgi:hypothetical protein